MDSPPVLNLLDMKRRSTPKLQSARILAPSGKECMYAFHVCSRLDSLEGHSFALRPPINGRYIVHCQLLDASYHMLDAGLPCRFSRMSPKLRGLSRAVVTRHLACHARPGLSVVIAHHKERLLVKWFLAASGNMSSSVLTSLDGNCIPENVLGSASPRIVLQVL